MRGRESANVWRTKLREKFGKMGYDECPLCGTPIRPVLYVDPTGKVQSRKGSCCAELNLKRMCEVCWRGADVGSVPVHEMPYGLSGMGR